MNELHIQTLKGPEALRCLVTEHVNMLRFVWLIYKLLPLPQGSMGSPGFVIIGKVVRLDGPALRKRKTNPKNQNLFNSS